MMFRVIAKDEDGITLQSMDFDTYEEASDYMDELNESDEYAQVYIEDGTSE